MKRNITKILLLLLTLSLTLGALAVTAGAEETDTVSGSGTQSDPYLVGTAEDFIYIMHNYDNDLYIRLTGDISSDTTTSVYTNNYTNINLSGYTLSISVNFNKGGTVENGTLIGHYSFYEQYSEITSIKTAEDDTAINFSFLCDATVRDCDIYGYISANSLEVDDGNMAVSIEDSTFHQSVSVTNCELKITNCNLLGGITVSTDNSSNSYPVEIRNSKIVGHANFAKPVMTFTDCDFISKNNESNIQETVWIDGSNFTAYNCDFDDIYVVGGDGNFDRCRFSDTLHLKYIASYRSDPPIKFININDCEIVNIKIEAPTELFPSVIVNGVKLNGQSNDYAYSVYEGDGTNTGNESTGSIFDSIPRIILIIVIAIIIIVILVLVAIIVLPPVLIIAAIVAAIILIVKAVKKKKAKIATTDKN